MFTNPTVLVKFHFYLNENDNVPENKTERELYNIPTEFACFNDKKYEIFESCYYDGEFGGRHYYILKLIEVEE